MNDEMIKNIADTIKPNNMLADPIVTRKYIKDNMDYFLFLLLPLLIFLVVFVFPNVSSLYNSLFKWNGMSDDKIFVGLKNFSKLFSDANFSTAMKNTFIYTVVLLIVQNLVALVISVLIYKQSKINNFYRTSFYLPFIFSTVAIGFIWSFIYDPTIGVLNLLLKSTGLGAFTHSWLSDKKTAIYAVTLVHIWWGIGQAMIIYIAGLQNIPGELYESATVEGCNEWQKFKYITVPLLVPTTVVNLVLTTIGGFRSFDFIYVMTGGGSDNGSLVLAMQLYKEGFQYNNIGTSSAIAVVLLAMVSVISFGQLSLFKERS